MKGSDSEWGSKRGRGSVTQSMIRVVFSCLSMLFMDRQERKGRGHSNGTESGKDGPDYVIGRLTKGTEMKVGVGYVGGVTKVPLESFYL